mgnify:CR=1 FL=1
MLTLWGGAMLHWCKHIICFFFWVTISFRLVYLEVKPAVVYRTTIQFKFLLTKKNLNRTRYNNKTLKWTLLNRIRKVFPPLYLRQIFECYVFNLWWGWSKNLFRYFKHRSIQHHNSDKPIQQATLQVRRHSMVCTKYSNFIFFLHLTQQAEKGPFI